MNNTPLLEKSHQKHFSSQTTKAMLMMLFAVVLMGFMNVLAKMLREHTQVTVLQAVLFRVFGMLYGSVAYLNYQGISLLKMP